MISLLVRILTLSTLARLSSAQSVSIVPTVDVVGFNRATLTSRIKDACSDKEVVEISNMGWRTVPKAFVRSSAIRAVLMTNNSLTDLPEDAFAETPNLECLAVDGNRLSFSTFHLRHDRLKTLIFDHQSLSEADMMSSFDCLLTNSVDVRLPNLENFSYRALNYDCLVLPIPSMPSLRNVDLSDSRLRSVTVRGNLSFFGPNLRSLHLERNNIDTLELFDLGNIEELYLDGNPLTLLNISDSNSRLRVLSLVGCLIDQVMNVNVDVVRTLDVSENQLREVSSSLTFPYMLENLLMEGNQLTAVPDLSSYYRLQRLSLARNLISQVTDMGRLTGLRSLILRDNRIAAIGEEAFFYLTQLEELDLSGNALEILPPNWHVAMPRLRALDLRSNRFARIYDMHLGNALNLTDLYVKGNRMTRINVDTLRTLPSQCVIHVT